MCRTFANPAGMDGTSLSGGVEAPAHAWPRNTRRDRQTGAVPVTQHQSSGAPDDPDEPNTGFDMRFKTVASGCTSLQCRLMSSR